MRYQSTITGVGPVAQEFLAERLLVVFNENAPPALGEIAYLHTIHPVEADMQVGDIILFGESRYPITAVGDEANDTFRRMGHCTFNFKGRGEAELPGQVELLCRELPRPLAGMTFAIEYLSEKGGSSHDRTQL